MTTYDQAGVVYDQQGILYDGSVATPAAAVNATPSIVARGKMFGPQQVGQVRYKGRLVNPPRFADDGRLRRITE